MTRKFTNWIDAYVNYTAGTEAPRAFHKWTAVSTIAAALGGKVWFDQRYFKWCPNFYIVLVAPAGVANKSTTAKYGHNLLKRLQVAKYGPNSFTWQKLIEELAQSTEGVQLEDGTFLNISALNVVASELGSMLNPKDREMIDVLTDLWDGNETAWKKSTKTQGEDIIENPWINFIAGTTPAWLSGNIPAHMVEAGFFSRIIFIYREKKENRIPYPDEHVMDDADEVENDLVRDLEKICLLRGAFILSDDAREFGKVWYNDLQDQIEDKNSQLLRLGTYVARRQTHLHKLAMVQSAAMRDDLVIGLEQMERASAMLLEAEHDMHRVYQLAVDNEQLANANTIVDRVRHLNKIPQEVLYKLVHSKMTYDAFNQALSDAIMSGRISHTTENNRKYLVSVDK